MTLPMTDLVAQLPHSYTAPPTIDDPDVDRYCRLTGPDIGMTARTVFRELGRFAKRETGECDPPMQVLADALRTSKGTIQRAIVSCQLGGLLEVAKVGTSHNRERNVYTFTGHRSGWMPAFMPPRAGLTLANYNLKLLTEQAAKIAALEALVAQLVDTETGEISPSTPSVPKKRDGETTAPIIVDQIRTYEEEGRTDTNMNSDIGSSSLLPSDQFSLHSPPHMFNEEYVDWAVPQFPEWAEAWNNVKKAAPHYKYDWPKFLEDLLRHHRPAKVEHAPIPKGQIRCQTCQALKPQFESFNGNCGRCKAAKAYENHMLSQQRRQPELATR